MEWGCDMNQREAFEAWYEEHCKPGVGNWFARDVDNNDEYYMSHTQTAWDAWQAALASQWQPIDTLPVKQMRESREMFVVRGFNVEGMSTGPYTTDPYCVWIGIEDELARWPHRFPPTHWLPLPPAP